MKPVVRRSGILAACAIGFAIPGAAHATPITLSNASTVLEVFGGEANNGLVPYGGYFKYTDVAAGEEVTWSLDPVIIGPGASPAVTVLSDGSAGGFGSPTDIGGGVVRSTATIPNVMQIQADTSLVGTNAQTTFTFTPIGSNPVGYRFLYYAELDLFSANDDTAAFTGSIAGGDLALYQFDSVLGGLTVKMTASAGADTALTLFGAGQWSEWGEALEAGDLSVLSSDGSNFATVGDLGLAFAFDLLFASPATLTMNFDTQPKPPAIGVPEPGTLALFGLGLAGLGFARRRKGT